MKYLNKYKIFESSNLNTLSDEELQEKLDWLRTEMADIQREISQVISIQKTRKENAEEIMANDMPSYIWDLDKSQLDWVLEHNNFTTQKHYDISREYLRQLTGVLDSGFNNKTNQFNFNIILDSFKDEAEKNYQRNEGGLKSIEFLGKNLKPNDDLIVNGKPAVLFSVLFADTEMYNYKLLYTEGDIDILNGRYKESEFKSLEDALKYLVKMDIDSLSYRDY
jgi:hypothetical protein